MLNARVRLMLFSDDSKIESTRKLLFVSMASPSLYRSNRGDSSTWMAEQSSAMINILSFHCPMMAPKLDYRQVSTITSHLCLRIKSQRTPTRSQGSSSSLIMPFNASVGTKRSSGCQTLHAGWPELAMPDAFPALRVCVSFFSSATAVCCSHQERSLLPFLPL